MCVAAIDLVFLFSRANTAFTQILSAYARRGAGLLALRTLLDDFMKNLEKDKTCNLELNPNRIYNQLISDYETNEGTESPLPKGVDDSTAAVQPTFISYYIFLSSILGFVSLPFSFFGLSGQRASSAVDERPHSKA